tara:strand:+ start:256 stop:462 length:207 start_codon:yes stop_codon:yes gene_type:complete
MWAVKTAVDPNEGIVGLNGDFYLLDNDGVIMRFCTKEDARAFIADVGEDPDDEYIDYVEINKALTHAE